MRIYPHLLLSMVAFCLIRCASAPMPLAVIPTQSNTILGSCLFSNSGTNLNLAYVAKNNLVFDLSLQGKLIGGTSAAYDLGLGSVSDDKKDMLLLTFGYGRHEVRPYAIEITSYYLVTNVDAFRTSVYLNHRLGKNGFLIFRTSYFWGDAGQRSVTNLGGPKHNFSSLAFEPALWGRIGKRKRCLIGLGGNWTFEKTERQQRDDKDLHLCPLWIGMGYSLEKKIR